jgi:hypothetical protein
MATEVASIGPVTVTYAFRSWVLVEAGGRSVQRRVGSSEELGAALAALGLPPTEADSLADRLWDARPRDARFATARPWETFWAAQGVSFGLFLFWTLVFVGVIVLIGLLLWITS